MLFPAPSKRAALHGCHRCVEHLLHETGRHIGAHRRRQALPRFVVKLDRPRRPKEVLPGTAIAATPNPLDATEFLELLEVMKERADVGADFFADFLAAGD